MSELKHRQYPYPDENVFLVLGSRDGKPGSTTKPLVVISAREERARQYYESISRWKAVGAASLSDMKKTKELFTQAKQDPGTLTIQGGTLAQWLGDPELWAATYQKDGAHFVQIVKAHSPRDVQRHLEKQGAILFSLSNENSIDKTIHELQLHQWGKGIEESYATDYENGELSQGFEERLANRTEEQRQRDKAFLERVRLRKIERGIAG